MVDDLLDALADDPAGAARIGDQIAYVLQRVADARTQAEQQSQLPERPERVE